MFRFMPDKLNHFAILSLYDTSNNWRDTTLPFEIARFSVGILFEEELIMVFGRN